jgi:hypothetical protein
MRGMDQWIQRFADGWPMIWANPKTFALMTAVIITIIWLIVNYSYSTVLSNKNSQIELQDRQLSDYKQKLDGASPDQAKAKIEALEATIRATVGSKWEPLSKSQVAALALRLKDIQKSRATIMYENALGKQLAQTIFDAFKEAGWTEANFTPGSGLGEGIIVGWSTRAVAIGDILTSTAKLKGVWAKDAEKEIPDLVIVGVGINPD